jgi:hypothetical protein
MLRRILRSQRLSNQFSRKGAAEPETDEDEGSEDSWNEFEDDDRERGEDRTAKRWVRQVHNGPWFASFERTMTKEEVLQLYRRVPVHYRTRSFWLNFSDLCVSRGWSEFTSDPRKQLDRVTLRPSEPSTTAKDPDFYRSCYIRYPDGIRDQEEPVTHWKMEPPTIFVGRGDHPLRGCLRRRVLPDDVTLNLSPDAPVPKLAKGHRWKAVVHRPECAWLWSWEDPLLGKMKYVYPASVSNAHAEAEKRKFDEAAELGRYIAKIRKFYTDSFSRGEFLELASVLYLIDNLGIRIGNDNNTAVDGATTLRVENIRLLDGHRTVWIRFLGKDSIEYNNKITCAPGFVETIKKLSLGKTPGDFLFPNVNARIVNSYLQSYHPSLKAKTFRTFNATQRFASAVNRYSPRDGDPVTWFKKCVMEIAVFCNHKRISTLRKRQEQYSPVTSITNYIDPRVVVSWARSLNVPLNKIYSRALLERFAWAVI